MSVRPHLDEGAEEQAVYRFKGRAVGCGHRSSSAAGKLRSPARHSVAIPHARLACEILAISITPIECARIKPIRMQSSVQGAIRVASCLPYVVFAKQPG